jgi:uncharacterized protein YndB with AHSA1/START domain
MSNQKTEVIKNLQEKSILVARTFHAPLATVWRAFTESALLDQWWAPAPWRVATAHMNFTEGGHWLYAMVSPEDIKHWGRMNYKNIDLNKTIGIEDVFCDDQGNVNQELPVSTGRIVFTTTEEGTRVAFIMQYETEAALLKIVEMGFELGITACFEQLHTLIDTL